jgi:hypothetical protein
MRAALNDPHIFGSILPGESWNVWRVILIAAMGEPLDDAERVIFKEVTGREHEPLERVDELWMICGRRSGKTRAIAIWAAYIAALIDFTDVLAPGERASLPIMSNTMWQAQKAMSYLIGIFTEVPALARLVIGQTADTISLSTRVDIECRPASFRGIRGGTFAALIGDEVAFWRSEEFSANADREILNAARPSLATTGGMMGCITSPHMRSGEAYNTFAQHFGEKGDPGILVGRGPTQRFNPTISDKIVERAYRRDPIIAATEWGGEFRSDLESYIGLETIQQHIIAGRLELPPNKKLVADGAYLAFVDPASGTGGDSMVLAIAHAKQFVDGEYVIVLDAIRERSRFTPEEFCAELCEFLKTYGVTEVVGDAWGAQFVRTQFEKPGRDLKYRLVADVDEEWKSKSDLYRQLVPLLNSPGRLELLDHPKMVAQFVSLERKTTRGSNRDLIDAPQGAHEDIANAAAGALLLAGKRFMGGNVWDGYGDNVHVLFERMYGGVY